MYDLMSEQKYHQFSNYKAVIDSLSYYQFYILKLVVVANSVLKAIVNSSTKDILKDFYIIDTELINLLYVLKVM